MAAGADEVQVNETNSPLPRLADALEQLKRHFRIGSRPRPEP
jgi:hypothetical protein